MSKPLTLISKIDGTKILTDTDTAAYSGLLRSLLEEYHDNSQIEIPEVKGDVLASVVTFLEYLNKMATLRQDIPKPLPVYDLKEFVSEWEFNFISAYDNKSISDLFELINAANYLDVRPLLELACAKSAIMAKDFDKDKFMEVFQIEQDMTEDDLKQLEKDFEKQKEEEIEKRILLEKERENGKINEHDTIDDL